MTEARLAAHMQISALRRLCEQEGGFPAILSKGDETAGDILIFLRERDGPMRLIRRAMRWDGPPNWAHLETQLFDNEEELTNATAKMLAVDTDMWLLELDVPHAERFIAIMGAMV